MKVYQKFLAKEVGKICLILVSVSLVFFGVIDFFERFSTFFRMKKPLLYFWEFLGWKGLVNLSQVFPYLLGLSAILTLLYLARTKELLALLSLSYTKREIFKNVFFLYLLINISGGIILNLLSPYAFYKATETWDRKILDKRKEFLIFKNRIIFEGENYLLMAVPLEPNGEYLGELLFLRLNPEEGVEEVIWADSALHMGEGWKLEEAYFQKKEKDFRPEYYQSQVAKLPFQPTTLLVVEKTIKFLSLKELWQRLKFLEKIGKPKGEVLAELIWRIFYLISGSLLSAWNVFVFLKNYSPITLGRALSFSLITYVVFSLALLLISILLSKLFYLSLFILLGLFLAFLGLIFFAFKEKELKLK